MPDSPLVVIGLCNPKSPSNAGSVMRAVGCYQADAVRYTGERLDRAAKYCTDTKDINSMMSLTYVDDLLHDLPRDMKVVCVELVEGATLLPEFVHPARAIYIFGPEDGSIPQDIIDAAHHVVYVPTIGCMNLAASVNVLLYDRLAKSDLSDSGEELIKSSRDTNNRLVCKY
ncbi:MAG: RNA methyltransferase [Hahellaceae bacterium]|nr:RNA methyltransferase [Hahellaceae bacterium]MCP5210275.1 RNA methyltransferase [Hahellaceae bacterium]